MPINFFRKKIAEPIELFVSDSRSVGILLLVCTVVSLVIANLPVGLSYIGFWKAEIDWLHAVHLPHSLLHFINDGLMALFFFMAGMEIKQEMLEGELSTARKASLPVAAA